MGEIVINEEISKRLNEDTTEEVNEVLTSEEITVTPSELEPVYNQVGELKGATVKKTRNRVQKATTSTKATSVQESIAKLQEKVVMLQYVDSIKVPDVPTGMSKEGRETLLQVGKDVEAMKGRLIAAIQKS